LPDFPIVDAHVHLYDPTAINYPWMAGLPALNARHASGEYTAATKDAAVVESLVFIEVDAAEGAHLEEVRWIESLARDDSRLRAIAASMPLEKGSQAVEADLARFAQMPLARSVRRLIQGHVNEPGWCLRPDFVDGVKAVGRHGLGFELCIYHPQMSDVIELVGRCPEVRFILDHIGKPGIKDGLREPWWTDMRTLASLPNVVCKISGVITEADYRTWAYDDVAPYVGHAIECFGFDRVIFGSDWPVVNLAASFKAWVDVLDRVTAGSPESDLRKLYRDNAVAWYRLGVAEP
jgi:L-fuconolactonase